MPEKPSHAPLEPVWAVMIAVVLGHGVLGLAVWSLLPLWKPARFAPDQGATANDGRYWFAPSDYQRVTAPGVPAVPPDPAKAPVTKPVKTAAAPLPAKDIPGTLAETPLPSVPRPETAAVRPTSKIITLSPVLEVDANAVPQVKPSRPPITMMEILNQAKQAEAEKEATGGANMDPVLKALEQALSQGWTPPSVQQVPLLQRDARLRFVIGKDGSVLEAHMTKKSGSGVLDDSVTDAGRKLKKISESLPSSFPKDRYTVEVNFHIE